MTREKKVKRGEQKFEKGQAKAEDEKYILRLYIAGKKRKSSKAIANLNRVCEEHLAGRYELEIIDILEQPTLARDEQIVAVPTLIKKLPDPLRKLIGDMSDKEKVLLGMDLRPKKQE
jgi:circadian clock protein KaiB